MKGQTVLLNTLNSLAREKIKHHVYSPTDYEVILSRERSSSIYVYLKQYSDIYTTVTTPTVEKQEGT